MKHYDKVQKECIYGHFDLDTPAGYTVTNGDKLVSPWYYVYNNRKVLLYVDQHGPVKVQYQPPNGILVFRRERGESESKWQIWVSSPDINKGMPVSNFNSPILDFNGEQPEFTVKWAPETAIYTAKFTNAEIVTEIFVPHDKATVCMKTTIKNTSGKAIDIKATPSMFPYVNIPQMVAWDLPQWYLYSTLKHRDNMFTFHGQMTDPHMIKEDNRSVTFNVDYDENAEIDLDLALYTGRGNFFSPEKVIKDIPFNFTMGKADNESFGAYDAVYAIRYAFTLQPGESKTLTQVLTIQEDIAYNEEENLFDSLYFDNAKYLQKKSETTDFYNQLFTKRTIKTSNPIYDNFINTFTPLQMFWVGSLDRGWPSSMRGIRDASQDFVGITHLYPDWTRETILAMFEHQQVDGWMPRQISTVSRTAPHDMRYYCDGGAFLIELVHEYLVYTRDTSILEEKVMWLDSDEKSTIMEHLVRCTQFYLEPHNIGEHGLCKVWFGDWWDPMDKIGMDGIGETVTVTAQMIYVLGKLIEMFNWLAEQGKLDAKYSGLTKVYADFKDKFTTAMNTHAFNKLGYYNAYFNDNRKWLLSDNDPDGVARLYLVSNAWALISGCADEKMRESVINNIEKENFDRMGYNTESKGFPTFIDKAGRIGNGTSPNASPYNHAQSFYARACCECGHPELAYKATRYILPIEEAYAPVEQTFVGPYCIVNGYSNSDKTLHRCELQFLSGTVSYVLRILYNSFMGINYGYNGLTMKPCLPDEFGDCTANFTYLGKKFTVNYIKTENPQKKFTLNGAEWKTEINKNSGKPTAFVKDSDMKDENIITIEY
ncbi:MAG: hypothetical protein IJO74_01645 [Clostridia bacterium]|nr:hypothetical protein [Clostridia bacterium]